MKSEVKHPAKAQSDSFKHQDLKLGTKRLTEHFKQAQTFLNHNNWVKTHNLTSKNTIWIIFSYNYRSKKFRILLLR